MTQMDPIYWGFPEGDTFSSQSVSQAGRLSCEALDQMQRRAQPRSTAEQGANVVLRALDLEGRTVGSVFEACLVRVGARPGPAEADPRRLRFSCAQGVTATILAGHVGFASPLVDAVVVGPPDLAERLPALMNRALGLAELSRRSAQAAGDLDPLPALRGAIERLAESHVLSCLFGRLPQNTLVSTEAADALRSRQEEERVVQAEAVQAAEQQELRLGIEDAYSADRAAWDFLPDE
jgi:hypothetical protein